MNKSSGTINVYSFSLLIELKIRIRLPLLYNDVRLLTDV